MKSRILAITVVLLTALLNAPAAEAALPGSFRWSSSGVLISPKSDATHNIAGIKDPTVVYSGGKYHVFASTANAAGYNLVYLNFSDWSQAASAPQYYLDKTAIGSGVCRKLIRFALLHSNAPVTLVQNAGPLRVLGIDFHPEASRLDRIKGVGSIEKSVYLGGAGSNRRPCFQDRGFGERSVADKLRVESAIACVIDLLDEKPELIRTDLLAGLAEIDPQIRSVQAAYA